MGSTAQGLNRLSSSAYGPQKSYTHPANKVPFWLFSNSDNPLLTSASKQSIIFYLLNATSSQRQACQYSGLVGGNHSQPRVDLCRRHRPVVKGKTNGDAGQNVCEPPVKDFSFVLKGRKSENLSNCGIVRRRYRA
jgi:hypothetical protein